MSTLPSRPDPFSLSVRPTFFRRGDLLAGLPALLAGALAVGIGAWIVKIPPGQIRGHYARDGQRALEAHDYAKAKICFERLLYDSGGAPEAAYQLAMALEGLGESPRAADLLRRAASLDQRGHAPAHLLLASRLLRAVPRPPGAVNTAERHLRRALLDQPRMAEAETQLGLLYATTGQPQKAVPLLNRFVEQRPELRMTLARAYRALDQTESAQNQAKLALGEFRRRVTADPDDVTARIRGAEAAAFLEAYADAVTLLSQGLARSGNARYRPSLGSLYAAWSDRLVRDQAPVGDRVLMLERGLEIDPANPALLGRLAQVLRTTGPEADQVRTRLESVLAHGQAAASVHFVLGVDAWLRNQPEAARLHLEQAEQLKPGSPGILNNLAWVLARSQPADLPRALALVNLALERAPNVSRFRGTRGTILALLGRWREALPDLEAALAKDPKNTDLHRSLADTYEHLDLPAMAAEHRRAAKAPQPKQAAASTPETPGPATPAVKPQ